MRDLSDGPAWGVFALIWVATVAIRILPRIELRDVIFSDTYYHLFCARKIRANRFRIPRSFPEIGMPHEYTYPFGYHWFLALFSEDARKWVERLTGAMFDSASVIVSFVASRWIFAEAQSPFPNSKGLAVAALFSLSPGFLRIGSGPRAYNGNARVVGQFLYLVHVTTAYLGLSQNHTPALALSAVAAAIMLFTSCFSNQVLAFFALPFAVFIDIRYLALVLAALALSLLLTGGKTANVLSGSIRHSVFYYQHLQKVFLYPHIVSWPKFISGARAAFRRLKERNFAEFEHWIFQEKHWAHLLIAVNPHIALALFGWSFTSVQGVLPRALWIWVCAGAASFLITKLRPIMFLGEGERYLESAVMPALVLWILYFQDLWVWSMIPLLGYSIWSAHYAARLYRGAYRTMHDDYTKTERLFAILREQPPGVLLPVGPVHWQCVYRADKTVICYGGKIDTRLLPAAEFMRVFGNYPFPGVQIGDILAEHHVSYVVADRASLEHYTKNILPRPEEFTLRVKVIAETAGLVAFRVVDSSEQLSRTGS